MIVALVLLACQRSAAEVPAAPEPPATQEDAVSTRPQQLDLDAFDEASQQAAREWGAAYFDAAPEQVELVKIGTRSGWPELGVRIPPGFLGPEARGRAGAVVPLIVRDGQVLWGPEGFRAFVAAEGREDPERLATAWVLLHRGLTREPLGPERVHRRAKTWPAPHFEGETLVFLYKGEGSAVLLARITIDEDGRPTTVSEEDGSHLGVR